MKRNLALVVVLVLIGGAVYYFESQKVHRGGPGGPTQELVASSSLRSKNYEANVKNFPKAKELVTPDGYINTGGKPITLAELVGKKVVLLDIWTYSCINCQRTTPYLNAWYAKYKDFGLEIVGVHTPEFNFEKEYANVEKAVQQFGIKYPVVQDNEFRTWDAYENNYWPAKFLIDTDGLIREQSIGEGHYKETEDFIQKLLKERKETFGLSYDIPTGYVTSNETAIDTKSPETYFNSSRNSNLGNGKALTPGTQIFTRPADVALNKLYLVGQWNISNQSAQNTQKDARIIFKYDAKNVYFVASAESATSVTIMRDGVKVKDLEVKDAKLYSLIDESESGMHTLEIIINGPGLDAFTFTFG